MADQGKISGFRLPDETLEKLDELQAEGIIKNRTDGVIKAIDRLYIEEDNRDNPFLRLLGSITHTSRITDSWEYLDKGASVLIIHDESGEEDLVVKLGENQAKVVRNVEGERVTVTIECEPQTIIIMPEGCTKEP
jgi:metal-responsive CopG/Arc/MetJ family transcriptional regulator